MPYKCNICGKQARKQCSGCECVYYCSVEHQKADWKQHRTVCKANVEQQSTTKGYSNDTSKPFAINKTQPDAPAPPESDDKKARDFAGRLEQELSNFGLDTDLMRQAKVAARKGLHEQALQLLLGMTADVDNAFGKWSHQAVDIRLVLGGMCMSSHPSHSVRLFRRALEIQVWNGKNDDAAHAQTLRSLALTLQNVCKDQFAPIALFKRALVIFESVEDHDACRDICESLFMSYEQDQKLTEAHYWGTRALNMFRAQFGPDHASTLQLEHRLEEHI